MPISQIISQHIQHYPKIQIQDLYKLLFQAAMGIEHLLQNPAPILDYLLRELDVVDAVSETQLAEPIAPELVRVHLRPFKARMGRPAQLVDLMMKSAANFNPSREKLTIYWHTLEEMAAQQIIPFSAPELQSFFQTKRLESLPAAHHSKIFRENYQPAYRVILKKYFAELQFAANGGKS